MAMLIVIMLSCDEIIHSCKMKCGEVTYAMWLASFYPP